jgi:hypothetical protein
LFSLETYVETYSPKEKNIEETSLQSHGSYTLNDIFERNVQEEMFDFKRVESSISNSFQLFKKPLGSESIYSNIIDTFGDQSQKSSSSVSQSVVLQSSTSWPLPVNGTISNKGDI